MMTEAAQQSDWFRETPESLAMLDEERKALAANEAEYEAQARESGCPKCRGWGSIETRKNVTGESVKMARICRTCNGSGRTR